MDIKEMALRAVMRGLIVLIFFLPIAYIITGMKVGIDGRHIAVWGLMLAFVLYNSCKRES